MALAGRRVLVTGVGGFVGSHLARALRAAGAELTGNAERVAGFPGPFVLADVTDGAALAAAVRAARAEVVVHLAGLTHVGESWRRPGDYFRVNFRGTRNLLRAAAGCRIVMASSGEVYGQVPESEQPIREDRPLDPRSPYAMTKACAEEVALEAGAIVVRSFNAVGPGQAPHFALPSFAAQLVRIARGEAEPVIRVGELSMRRDFLHVADAVTGYLRLIEAGEPGTVYNLASGEATSIQSALDRLMRIAGVEARVERDPEKVRPVDVPLLCGDAGRLRALGWKPERGLDAALADLWALVSGATAPEGT